MVYKVKEPLAEEYGYFRDDLLLFTYLHLAAEAPLTEALVNSGVTGIAYEPVEPEQGGLPLLTPMSEETALVVEKVTNLALLRKARIHPIAVLAALKGADGR